MGKDDQLQVEALAILGGTFDPVHYGHLRVAEEVRQKLGLKSLSLLPAGTPAHRDMPAATAEQRLQMLRLSQVEFPALAIDEREIHRSGPSYMVDTLLDLRSAFPQRPLLLLIGQDAANHLTTWYRWEQLFSLTNIVILSRPGSRADYRQDLARQIERRNCPDVQTLLSSMAGAVFSMEVVSVDISATTIKSIIRLGRSPRGMLPANVLDYINQQRLYLPG